MSGKVIAISATGVRGEIKGKRFIAKPDREDFFILNKKTSSPAQGNTTNRKNNKVRVQTLDEAAELLQTNEYLINLIGPGGQRALRQFSSVTIERAA